MSTATKFPLIAKIDTVRAEARDVMSFTLVAEDGNLLPACSAGGHIEISLPNGLTRHYSLVNDCSATDYYMISVGRPTDSRGGSDYIHSHFREGTSVRIANVKNNFELDTKANAYRFVAGGIGITPIMPMIRWCRQNDKPWRLIYAARSRQRAAYYEELSQISRENTRFHFDDEAGEFLDVDAALSDLGDGDLLYCCGPEPLMKSVQNATEGRPAGQVNFEWFSAPEVDAAVTANDGEFTVTLKRTGTNLSVPAGQSILDVIKAAGFEHPSSCREGSCGTCATKVLEGEPEHRDYVLSDEEQARGDQMMICVSRSHSSNLVLDI